MESSALSNEYRLSAGFLFNSKIIDSRAKGNTEMKCINGEFFDVNPSFFKQTV